ncbi:MAG: hypothetical protein ACR2M1_01780 [Gemmatimonadaceae bacterium]
MAEIPIQRKTGPNIWPWIIGLVVLALLGWFLFGRNNNNAIATSTTDSTAMMNTAPGAATAPAVNPAGTPGATMTPGTTTPATPGTMTPGTTTPGTTTPGTMTPGTPGTATPGSPAPASTP